NSSTKRETSHVDRLTEISGFPAYNPRLHYARTLDFWSANLEARLKEAARLVPEETLRIWRLYLAGCAYGFKRGWINLHQILAIRPHEDGSHELPWSRRDLYA
ncbi:class I SAM-dependent methyltransferase, partial [Pseudomonas aeruginosa]|nr:class I SAM-dependent methyltransferase [Pseudomonas aeruginosa]MCS9010422.1 class I SAM-dependent methyltransferase [Pseudomonas aeruginosa]